LELPSLFFEVAALDDAQHVVDLLPDLLPRLRYAQHLRPAALSKGQRWSGPQKKDWPAKSENENEIKRKNEDEDHNKQDEEGGVRGAWWRRSGSTRRGRRSHHCSCPGNI
jgi:hypothetical protein